MTSQINYSNIDALYPVAGQDNDSQGFRDNFGAIKTALQVARDEISDIQTNAVLVANLTDNTPVTNDLNGSTIADGFFSNFHGTSFVNSVTGAYDIDIRAGAVHQYTLSDDIDFTFRNWPIDTKFAKITVHFLSNQVGEYQVSLYTENGGTIVYDSEYPTALRVPSTGKHQVIEAWTYNEGATVYVRYINSFAGPSNNRSISGTLTVSGISTLAATNVTTLTASGASTLAAVSAASLTVSTSASFNTISVSGNSTLGNASSDKITILGIPKFPLLTTIQRDELTAELGMVVFNTTLNVLQVCTVPGVGVLATWTNL